MGGWTKSTMLMHGVEKEKEKIIVDNAGIIITFFTIKCNALAQTRIGKGVFYANFD